MEPSTTRAESLADRMKPWLSSVLLLLLVPLLFYGSMVFSGKEPAAPDTQASSAFGPWGQAETKASGSVPQWYPYIFSGMPSYGSFLYMPRSPLNVLGYLVAPFAGNRGARYVLFFFIAGLATALFVHRQGVSRLAATASGLLFAMTPYFPGSVAAGHSTKIESLCLVPVLLLALDALLARPNLLRASCLALAAASLAWAHHPQIAFYAVLIGKLYAIARLFLDRRWRTDRSYLPKLFGYAALAVAFGAGLLAEPYLSVREYAPFSVRGGNAEEGPGSTGAGWDYATAWSFHPKELISFAVPAWYGLHGATYWGPMPFTQSTHFFGLLAILLAAFGLYGMRARQRWVWFGISLFVLFVGFGRWLPILYGPLYAGLPLFNKFRVPSMIYSLLPFCLAVPMAGGIDFLRALYRPAADRASAPGGKASPRNAAPRASLDPLDAEELNDAALRRLSPRAERVAVVIAAVGVLCFLVALLGSGAMRAAQGFVKPGEAERGVSAALSALISERATLWQAGLFTTGLWLLLFAAWAEATRHRILPARWSGLFLAAIAVGEVVWVARAFHHPEEKRVASAELPVPGAVEYLKSAPGPFRIFPVGPLFGSNAFGHARLESVGGYQPAKLRVYQDLLDADALTTPGVLEMLNVKYIVSAAPLELRMPPVSSKGGYVYALPDALPRVWSVEHVRKVAAPAEMMRRLKDPDFHPAIEALVYADQPTPPETSFAPAEIQVETMGAGRLRFRSEADGPALAVVSEIWYPPAMTATVDGAPVPIYRVNHALRALRLPAGSHEVELSMGSRSYERGRRISAATFGVMILTTLLGVILAKRRAAS